METFNIHRFWLLLKWQLVQNRSKSLGVFLGAFLTFLFVEIINLFFGESIQDNISLIKFAILAYSIIGVCCTYSMFKTKQKRITLMMQPSSNIEKYVVLLASSLIVWTISVFVAFMLADALRMLFGVWFFSGEQLSGIPALFTGDWYHVLLNGKSALDAAEQILTIIWIHSWFLLGGVFFRRHAVLLSALSMFIFSFFSLAVYAVIYGDMESAVMAMLSKSDILIIDVMDLVLIVVQYMASYWLFKRMQVINNKWINV